MTTCYSHAYLATISFYVLFKSSSLTTGYSHAYLATISIFVLIKTKFVDDLLFSRLSRYDLILCSV